MSNASFGLGKWMLRAAYFAQELMSTFGTSIGEVALVPSTGPFLIFWSSPILVNFANAAQEEFSLSFLHTSQHNRSLKSVTIQMKPNTFCYGTASLKEVFLKPRYLSSA